MRLGYGLYQLLVARRPHGRTYQGDSLEYQRARPDREGDGWSEGLAVGRGILVILLAAVAAYYATYFFHRYGAALERVARVELRAMGYDQAPPGIDRR